MAKYIDNKRFTQELGEYSDLYRESKENNSNPPKISDYIGECIMKISKKLASKPNFSGYSYKEDMIGDGIENCLKYMHNFDTNKSSNAFAYCTQIIYAAFLRRMQKEKRQEYIKYKLFELSGMENLHHNNYEMTDRNMEYENNPELSLEDIRKFDEMVKPKSKRLKKYNKTNNINNLDDFI